MIFGIPTKKDWDELKEMRERNALLRDKVFEVIFQSQNYMKDLGLLTTKEYWKWRLDFDKQRYGIKD